MNYEEMVEEKSKEVIKKADEQFLQLVGEKRSMKELTRADWKYLTGKLTEEQRGTLHTELFKLLVDLQKFTGEWFPSDFLGAISTSRTTRIIMRRYTNRTLRQMLMESEAVTRLFNKLLPWPDRFFPIAGYVILVPLAVLLMPFYVAGSLFLWGCRSISRIRFQKRGKAVSP